MTKPDEEAKTPHAPGSQPSTGPGSDEPQTITAPTPPVAWTTGPPDQDDIADQDDMAAPGDRTEEAGRSKRPPAGDGPP